jgi:hypothetical protein
VVFTGGLVGREMLAPYRFLVRNILPAVRGDDPLSARGATEALFESSTARVGEGQPRSSEATSPAAEAVTGGIFEIEDHQNLLGIEELAFQFPQPDLARVGIVYSGTGKDADWGVDVVFRSDDLLEGKRRIELEVGLDGRPRETLIEHEEVGTVPVSGRAQWEGPCQLVMTVVTGWAIPQTWTADFCDVDDVSLNIKNIFYDTTVTGRRRDEEGRIPTLP